MRPNLASSFVMSALILVGASSARAGDDLDEEQVATYAVQSRMFRLGGELAVAGGILPMNAFDKGLTVGGSFTYHFNNIFAWEIINGSYVYKQLDTDLKTELVENFQAKPTEIAALDLLLSSSLVLKPFYGKLAFFNRRVIHMELSVPFGAAVGRYANPQAYLFGPTAGLLFHIYLSPHASVRFDARENVLINRDNWHMRHELHVSLGLALAWGGDER